MVEQAFYFKCLNAETGSCAGHDIEAGVLGPVTDPKEVLYFSKAPNFQLIPDKSKPKSKETEPEDEYVPEETTDEDESADEEPKKKKKKKKKKKTDE